MRRTRNYVVPAVFSGLMIVFMFVQFGIENGNAHLFAPILFSVLLLVAYGAEVLLVRRKKYNSAIVIAILKNLCLLMFMPLMNFEDFSAVMVSELLMFTPMGLVTCFCLLFWELPASFFVMGVYVLIYWLPIIALGVETALLVLEKKAVCPKSPKQNRNPESQPAILTN